MSSSMTVEEKFEAVIKQMHEMFIANQELKAQNEYFRKRLGDNMKQKQKLQDVSEWLGTNYGGEEEASNALSFSDDDVPFERTRREARPTFNSSDFKAEYLSLRVS